MANRKKFKGLGGMVLCCQRGQGFKVGDITVIVENTNSNTGKWKQLRVIAPREKEIKRVYLIKGEIHEGEIKGRPDEFFNQ